MLLPNIHFLTYMLSIVRNIEHIDTNTKSSFIYNNTLKSLNQHTKKTK